MVLIDSSLGRLHRATWVSTELMLTFAPPVLRGVHLVPFTAPETAGTFRVWLHLVSEPAVESTSPSIVGSETEDSKLETAPVLVWDRKIEGRFPELKELVSGDI